jgi:hypothetical protein
MLLLAVVLFALAALVPGLAAPAQAQTTLPNSLQNEMFFAADADPAGGPADLSADPCPDVPGESYRLSYRASGIATGPYPGTFFESGIVTVESVAVASP